MNMTVKQHIRIAVESLRTAHVDTANERERDDLARAMFHLGSAYGVLEKESDATNLLINQSLGISRNQYSEEKLHPGDEGDLAIAVGLDRRRKLIHMEFGKAVKWTAFNLASAKDFCECLSKCISELERL